MRAKRKDIRHQTNDYLMLYKCLSYVIQMIQDQRLDGFVNHKETKGELGLRYTRIPPHIFLPILHPGQMFLLVSLANHMCHELL